MVTNLLFWQVDEITASGAFSIIVSNQTGTVYSLATSPNGLLYINYVYATGGPAMNKAPGHRQAKRLHAAVFLDHQLERVEHLGIEHGGRPAAWDRLAWSLAVLWRHVCGPLE